MCWMTWPAISAWPFPQEFDEREIGRRMNLAAASQAPRSMYIDGAVCGDGEGGDGSDGQGGY